MRIKAREKVENKFDRKIVIKSYLNALKKLEARY